MAMSKRTNAAIIKPRGAGFSLNAAGAADEDMFIKTFEVVPRIVLYSQKDLNNELTDIINILNDPSKDWEKRVEVLKRIRSLIIAGATEFEDFFQTLKQLQLAMEVALKDLRSKVVREACITIAFMSQFLGMKVDRFVEGLLQLLFNLIPNSAKIMSTSGTVCIRFVIQYTHAPRLIPIICGNMNSKAKEIRKAVCEFLDQLLHTWSTHSLEKHMSVLQEALRKGINDADSEARVYSRKAFWGFADHFKDQADSMIHSLDAQKQKALYGEVAGGLSASNSINSLNSQPVSSSSSFQTNGRVSSLHPSAASSSRYPPPSRFVKPSVSTSNSVENLYRPWSAMSGTRLPTGASSRGSKIPVFSPKEEKGIPTSSPFRYGSAIDVGAARRARARAVIASAMAQPQTNPNSFMSRSVMQRSRYESPIATAAAASVASPDSRQSRSNGRVSQSQPSSRSTSPSSCLNPYRVSLSARKSSIPKATSREVSPARHYVDLTHVTQRSAARSRKVSDTVDSPLNDHHLSLNTTPRLDSNQFSGRFRRSSEGYDLPVNGTNGNGNGNGNLHHSPPSRLSSGGDANNHHHNSSQEFSCLSADHCLDMLKPVIGELPSNQAAIKMLTKLVEQQPKAVVSGLLPDMMPALVQAYDSPEIAVRKAAVFAMVSIHNVVGEDEMKKFLLHLNGSKMKLLNLYIERSKNSNSTTTSNSSSNGYSTPT